MGFARKLPLPGVPDAALVLSVDLSSELQAFDEVALVSAAAVGLLLVLGLIWAFFVAAGSGNKWGKRLGAELDRVAATGFASRIEAKTFPKAFRSAIEKLNGMMEQAAKGGMSGGLAGQVLAHRDADISSVLGEAPPADLSTPADFPFGGGDGAVSPDQNLSLDPPAAPAHDADSFGDSAPSFGAGADPQQGEGASFDPFGAADNSAGEDPSDDAASFDPFGAASQPVPAAPPPPPPPPAAAMDPFAEELSQSSSDSDYFSDSTRVVNLNDLAAQEQAQVKSQAAPPLDAADPFAAAYSDGGGLGDEEEGHDATVVAKVPDALLAATARAQGGAFAHDPDEEHFRQVFQDFVATRRHCGEPSDGLTYEKFSAKLKKNRDAIKDKHAARSVRFQVYVKAGKASLKATPVK